MAAEKAKEFLEEYGLPFRGSLPNYLKRNHVVSAMNFLTSITFYKQDCQDKAWKDERKLKRWKKAKKPIKKWELSYLPHGIDHNIFKPISADNPGRQEKILHRIL